MNKSKTTEQFEEETEIEASPTVDDDNLDRATEGRPQRTPVLQRTPNLGLDREAGTSDRARYSRQLQIQVGNSRMGEFLSADQQEQPAQLGGVVPRIQRHQAAPISSPLPPGTRRNRRGAAVLNVGGVPVTILPDTTSRQRRMRGRAKTRVRLNWKTPKYRTLRGTVEWVGSVLQPTVTIRTTYGRGVTRRSQSAYGRGTTRADIAAGLTSLRHHEGIHGQDYLDYLNNHPLPEFSGRAGMSVREYRQAVSEYNDAMRQFQQDMESQSRQATDCVGIPGADCGP
jgi:hypothetical protein